MLGRLKQELRALVEYSWGYMGTLAAMGLLIGVLGMGMYHAFTRDAEYQAVRCYGGIFNSADASPPTGLDELPGSKQPAVPHLRFEYGKNGRLERLVHISAEGNPTAMPGSRVAEQRLQYDAAGRITRKANYGATGAPVTDASGVHARAFSYDEEGRLVRTEFLDHAGRLIVPRMPGYAVESIIYDTHGRPETIIYQDGLGNPITNSRGERRIEYRYDDTHGCTTRTNYIAGVPADDAHGIACQRTYKAQDGRSTWTSWYNAAGEPAHDAATGAVSLLTEVSRDGAMRRERACEEGGEPCRQTKTSAEHIVRTTPQGLIEWECYNDADGLPCVHDALGYAERVCEYGADGALMKEYFWDAAGNPCPRYEKRYCHTTEGEHVLTLLTDGSTELRKTP